MGVFNYLRRWWLDERGQDLVEYTLLLSFVVLNSAALMLYNAELVQAVWDDAAEALEFAADHGL